jgi:hypothetical protein
MTYYLPKVYFSCQKQSFCHVLFFSYLAVATATLQHCVQTVHKQLQSTKTHTIQKNHFNQLLIFKITLEVKYSPVLQVFIKKRPILDIFYP